MATINIQLKTEEDNALRYGYITKNDRVHGNANISNTSYGAATEGDMGLARHTDLQEMFNHPNAFVNGLNNATDRQIAAKFLQGRVNLISGSITADTNTNATIQSLDNAINSYDSDLEASKTLTMTQEQIDAIDDRKSDGANPDPEVQILVDQKANLDDGNVDNDFLLSGELGYNPDFPASSFSYTYTRTGSPRANDGVSSASRAPNVAVPSEAELLYANSDHDVTVSATAYQGGGGFGPKFETGITGGGANIIDNVISKYSNS